MRALRYIAVCTVAIALWAALVLGAVFQGWFHASLAPRGDARAFMTAATQRIESAALGDCALALIEHGRVFDRFTFSIGRPIDDHSLFQMASVSKWVTAWGVMTLVEAGRIDLDAPVSRYLKRWQLPESAFANDAVTVRRLLSHTAGLTDGLGYLGFPPDASPQTLVESLTHTADPMPGADGRVRIGRAPGTRWQYSGGGFSILQLLIEDVTGVPFADYLERTVLTPLRMSDSTFDADVALSRSLAPNYGPDRQLATRYRFTALAAASLYSTLADMTRFVLAQAPAPSGAPPGRGVLAPATLEAMRAPIGTQFGRNIWGLGTMLAARSASGGYIVGHDGNNYPAINHALRVDPATGDGIVVLSSGSSTFASALAGEWVRWKTGNVDLVEIARQLDRMLLLIGAGAAVAIALGVGAAYLRRRR